MKSTPMRGVKQYLKRIAYKQLEGFYGLTAYLLHNGVRQVLIPEYIGE